MSVREQGATKQCDVLYYDGQCPLCRREMRSLKAQAVDTLVLQDVHQLDEMPDDLSKAELLKILHLRRADGGYLRGVDANIAAWQHGGGARFLRVLRWPLIRQLVDIIYAVWAEIRYRRLYDKA